MYIPTTKIYTSTFTSTFQDDILLGLYKTYNFIIGSDKELLTELYIITRVG